MPEVLEVEQHEAREIEESTPKWDSWVVEIPEEIIKAQNLLQGSIAILTVRDGKLEAEVTSMSDEMQSVSERILEQRRDVHEELKRLGD